MRAVFENQEEMMEANAAAAETIPANIERNSFLAAASRRDPLLPVPADRTRRTNGLGAYHPLKADSVWVLTVKSAVLDS